MAMPRASARLPDVTQGLPNLSMRRRRRLALLVLPALLLRALIPAGFMPVAGGGGAYLGFCPGAGELPPHASQLAAHAEHGSHTHHGAGAPHAPGSGHHPACVFSTGATTAVTAIFSAALPAPVLTAPVEHVASLTFLPAILRAQSSRGPPVLA